MITITIILEERDENVTVRCEAKSEPPNPGTQLETKACDNVFKAIMQSNGGVNIKSITDITFDK